MNTPENNQTRTSKDVIPAAANLAASLPFLAAGFVIGVALNVIDAPTCPKGIANKAAHQLGNQTLIVGHHFLHKALK